MDDEEYEKMESFFVQLEVPSIITKGSGKQVIYYHHVDNITQ